MLENGDYVQTRRRSLGPPLIVRGTRGTVRHLHEDWATVELPSGGRFQSHIDNLTRLVKREETLGR